MTNLEARMRETDKRAEQVGKYFFETGKSTREISKYFTENYFPISNKTVSEYIKRYIKKRPYLKEEIEEKIALNTEQDYKTEEVQKQILIELDLLFKGYTIEEIASIFDKGSSSVQRDLTTRLKKLSKDDEIYLEFYRQAQEKLKSNQVSTIEANRKTWK